MRRTHLLSIAALTTLLLSSCEVIGGIFKAGVWTGIIMVVAVIALLIWIFVKLMGGNRR
ncbi:MULTISPECIES: hypothetical protein [Sphingobacterium]|uniref:hypothetical protein n=1 Tax=Sphingobacterium TaxID=28453 RepID=UPI0018CDF854|nr:hypothetical protein [Sphingobacterium sp. T2]